MPIDTDSDRDPAVPNELFVALTWRAAAGVAVTAAITLSTDVWPRDRIESLLLAWLCACADHPVRCAVASTLLIVALGPELATRARGAGRGGPLEES